MKAQWEEWCKSRDGDSVKFVSEEEYNAVFLFSKSQATVSIANVDGSFFAEALEDASETIEDWVSDANSYFSEKSGLSLADALDHLLKSEPGRGGVKRSAESDEEFEDDGIDEDLLTVDDARKQKREDYDDDRKWENFAETTACQGSREASQVLMREMRKLLQLQGEADTKALGVEMVRDSLYQWCVTMHADSFPKSCPLKDDLIAYASGRPDRTPAVVMDVTFPSDYPFSPPFIRVVRPRFQFHTGHVTIGGSVCMELLTPSGWLPTVSLESVFVQIRSEMIEGGGRLDRSNQDKDYSMSEAREAFNRVAQRYGWMK